jgi:protein ImuB
MIAILDTLGRLSEHMFAMQIACALVPRFHLIAAAGGREELLRRPCALAPEPGGEGVVGEPSGAAEAFGVRAGMRLGEALSRCPELALLPQDPERADSLWEGALRRLEEIGARVESERPGEAFFAVDGLRGLHGGTAGTLAHARRAVGMPVRIAAAPARFSAFAAALDAPRRTGRRGAGGRETVIRSRELRAFLSSLPVSLLAPRLDPGDSASHQLVTALERLGIKELGSLAELPASAVADRFGVPGLRARSLARGKDEPLRPRRPHDLLAESVELPEAMSGSQLERALSLLIDRLLADPRRRGRTVRALRIGARLAGGGGWRSEATLRRPSARPDLLRMVLTPKLGGLPGPASELSLEATALGAEIGDQLELARSERERRRERLGEAVRQVRAAAGPGALLRVLEADLSSRVPERRALLTPFPET